MTDASDDTIKYATFLILFYTTVCRKSKIEVKNELCYGGAVVGV